jgi:lysophospholipid acyltransferase (LPLAT)-like uncharacterized protein
MAGWVKRVLRSKAAMVFATGAISRYVRLVKATSRWQTVGGEHPEKLWDAGKPFILSFWHGRLLMMPLLWRRGSPIHLLISHHRDGELIARAMVPFGFSFIRGSASKPGRKNKGGTGALRAILRQLRLNECVGMTPDGPRGPRMRASSGVVAAARLAQVPILPVTYAVARRRVINSWDRFILPWPFNRGVYLWGEPIDVHSDTTESPEQAALRLETIMNGLCDEADRLCGHAPIAPADRLPAAGGDA